MQIEPNENASKRMCMCQFSKRFVGCGCAALRDS
jgi:hypothetical protein